MKMDMSKFHERYKSPKQKDSKVRSPNLWDFEETNHSLTHLPYCPMASPFVHPTKMKINHQKHMVV